MNVTETYRDYRERAREREKGEGRGEAVVDENGRNKKGVCICKLLCPCMRPGFRFKMGFLFYTRFF